MGHLSFYFLGVFEKLRDATVGHVFSICRSLRMEQLGSHWTDFHEIWYLHFFRRFVEKLNFH
jgi:hypothetical protein